jgi:hypothetical protein
MPARLNGVPEMKAAILAARDQLFNNLVAAVKDEYGIELEEAKARCPVDVTKEAKHPGALRSTGQLIVYREGGKVKVVLSFGGTTLDGVIVDYAVYVHENLEAHHEVGQAKFLESVLNESAPFMMERVAARMSW